ncbi:MAG: hypothetical protein HFJ54_01105 [Clostridia bacterium]|nr:hypothetical protein [Clostridia bacterium]
MKKIVVFIIVLIVLLLSSCTVFATADEVLNKLDSNETSQLVRASAEQKADLEKKIEEYGSETYGFTAFILDKIRIFSIPFCFLGIVISAIYQYVIGIRKLDVRYKGFYTMIAFITLFVIAQVLPLIFVIVIKGFGRS